MKLEYVILAHLILKPETGYRIKTVLDSEWRFLRRSTPNSQLYTTLRKMANNGWIDFDESESTTSRSKKTYYITDLGKSVFFEWLEAPLELSFRYQEGEFLGKFTFSFLIDKEIALYHLRTELAYREEQIRQFRNRDRRLTDLKPAIAINEEEAQWFLNMTHEFGSMQMDNYVAWLREVIRTLSATL